ncbi:MAG: hypothetical protein ACYCXW_10765, partial [Solirubrobacteraceae bacterium]
SPRSLAIASMLDPCGSARLEGRDEAPTARGVFDGSSHGSSLRLLLRRDRKLPLDPAGDLRLTARAWSDVKSELSELVEPEQTGRDCNS